MKVRIQKWGNSLAVRIPRSFALERQLVHNSEVDIALTDDGILLMPIRASDESLEEMLARITPENLHDEIGTGSPVGVEGW